MEERITVELCLPYRSIVHKKQLLKMLFGLLDVARDLYNKHQINSISMQFAIRSVLIFINLRVYNPLLILRRCSTDLL